MGNRLKITSWNVNSIKARHDAVLAWIERNDPDVLCLQETKTLDDGFPFADLSARGYHAVTNGQKTYNGVAIVSRTEPAAIRRGMGDDDPQARLISAQIAGVTVVSAYFPNGSEVGSEKYVYKLGWLKRFREWFGTSFYGDRDVILCGDFNIAATDIDVRNPAGWEGSVIFNPEMRREFELLAGCGLIDVYRKLNPGLNEYSWWDYRMAGFRRNDGVRLDYVMANPRLAEMAVGAHIDRAERAGERPSDHAPVTVEFDLP